MPWPPNIPMSHRQYHIDILTAHFVRHPDWFDVVVGSNLFGDILSDLGPAVVGSIGIAPSANLNPEKEYPSMFEPCTLGPDIAERESRIRSGRFGRARYAPASWRLGSRGCHRERHRESSGSIENPHPDIGGKASTEELGTAIAMVL